MERIQLGDEVKDTVTSYQGIGRGRKDDAERTFPACGPHYANLHLKYFPGFPNLVEGCHAASVKLSRDERLAIAAEYEALWQAHVGGAA